MGSTTSSSPSSEVGPSVYSLTGSYPVKLSRPRARLVLPSVWREAIPGPVKVGPCPYKEGVRVYPCDEFARVVARLQEERLDGKSWARELSAWLGRYYFEVSPDSAGRIEIPPTVFQSFDWPENDELTLIGGHSHVTISAPVAEHAPIYGGLPDLLPAYL
jgi:DNA-binding transcriptional regulator/RsmH inhibitor MraZ